MSNQETTVIVGLGPGNGAALARAFATRGDFVVGLARRPDTARQVAQELSGSAYECDATDLESIRAAIHSIVDERNRIDNLIFNAGPGRFGPIDKLEVDDLENDWQINVRGCFEFGKQILPHMAERGSGNFLAIGAGATFRGRPTTLSFASAKAGQRIMLEALARNYGPQGVHVAYLILDGGVESAQAREHFPDHPEDGLIQPSAVASAATYLAEQPRSAWSFEHLIRPYVETW